MWNQTGEHSLLQGKYTSIFFLLLEKQDLTHYFVMTAKKDSLVRKGVLLKDTGSPNGMF